MKYMFLSLIFLVLLGCFVIPPAEFTFINNSSGTLNIVPLSGEDWDGFSLAPGETRVVESEKSNLFFEIHADLDGDGMVTELEGAQWEYDQDTYTFTFTDALLPTP